MKADFAYIDDAVSTLCERELKDPTISRDGVKAAATKAIAGFHIFDPEEEKRQIDAATNGRRAEIAAFQHERDVLMTQLGNAGIVPLAVVPTTAWRAMCKGAGLYRFAPDERGTVGILPSSFDKLKATTVEELAKQLEYVAKRSRGEYLGLLFPNGESEPVARDFPDASLLRRLLSSGEWPIAVTLVLPEPPADVVDILLKAHDAKISLKVAAVADAVSFKETPSQIAGRIIAEQEAAARRLRDDPIIYTEGQIATAILAQFGDFPIERDLVDRVMSGQTALRFFPQFVNLG